MVSKIKHGTRSKYTNHGCRCRPCTVAASKETTANRRARLTPGIDFPLYLERIDNRFNKINKRAA